LTLLLAGVPNEKRHAMREPCVWKMNMEDYHRPRPGSSGDDILCSKSHRRTLR
jgi:hypothetical protein